MASPTTLQWAEIHRRLAVGEAHLAETFQPTPAREQQTLQARAAALRARQDQQAPEPTVTLLLAQAGTETLAFELPPLREVVRLASLTPVPGAARELCGLANWHGDLLSVVDPLQLLGQGSALAEAPLYGLVLRHASWRVALGLAQISGLQTVALAAHQQARATGLLPLAGATAVLVEVPLLLQTLAQRHAAPIL